MAAFTPRIGDTVGYYARKYVKGSRGPNRPARYTYSYRCNGVLLAKNDKRGFDGILAYAGWTQEQIDTHVGNGNHVGLMNAIGATVAGDLTEGNNPILLPTGEVVWVYAEQVRKPR
jgi:hypothetical protein